LVPEQQRRHHERLMHDFGNNRTVCANSTVPQMKNRNTIHDLDRLQIQTLAENGVKSLSLTK
jgi:hypothetical protein